jgi:hypothetical protein
MYFLIVKPYLETRINYLLCHWAVFFNKQLSLHEEKIRENVQCTYHKRLSEDVFKLLHLVTAGNILDAINFLY